MAIVAIRQSTNQQVAENRESTNRQDALVKRAIELGWHRDRRKVNRQRFSRSSPPSDTIDSGVRRWI
jgi:hypothetical protein